MNKTFKGTLNNKRQSNRLTIIYKTLKSNNKKLLSHKTCKAVERRFKCNNRTMKHKLQKSLPLLLKIRLKLWQYIIIKSNIPSFNKNRLFQIKMKSLSLHLTPIIWKKVQFKHFTKKLPVMKDQSTSTNSKFKNLISLTKPSIS